jgi:glucose-6-phosphate dehydrogenase assembly protein OpcA
LAPAVATLPEDRVRSLHWAAKNTDLATVIEQLRRQERELSEQDIDHYDHPHPRNSVLNLVVTVADHHRAGACHDLISVIATSHPLRAVLVHLGGGQGPGDLDADITTDAHQLVGGFPVQRSQALLHVRGEASTHLASLVEALLVPDVPTYVWWSGREQLDDRRVRDVLEFADVLVVDSATFDRPAEGLLTLASRGIGGGRTLPPLTGTAIQDLGWARLRPWRDAVAQAFAPADRHPLLAGLREVEVAAADSGRAGLVGAALLAGWVVGALGWRVVATRAVGETVVEAVAEGHEGRQVPVVLRAADWPGLATGNVCDVRLTGHSGDSDFALAIEREPGSSTQTRVTIDLGGSQPPVQQRLTLPPMTESDLMLHMLWASRDDPVFDRSLAAAVPLLEALA